MDKEQFDAIARRFDFAAWQGTNRLDSELIVRNIALPGELIAGLEPGRIREIDPGDGSRLLRMSWAVPGHETALLVMDIREYSSRDAAHSGLLEILANMQAPDVKRLEGDAPGDVAFARDATTAIVFARGNIAVKVFNGGESIAPVGDVAKTIDDFIVAQH